MNTICKVTVVLLSTIFLAACVTSDIAWRTNSTPKNKDDKVRFKATYYFRVIDSCQPPSAAVVSNIPYTQRKNSLLNPIAESSYILSDTLYRFNLTGKASSWSSVKFESGTLRASQIDPFGNSIKPGKNGDINFISTGEKQHLQAKTEMEENLIDIKSNIEKIQERKAQVTSENPANKEALLALLANNEEVLEQARLSIFEHIYGSPGIESSATLPDTGGKQFVKLDQELVDILNLFFPEMSFKLGLNEISPGENFDIRTMALTKLEDPNKKANAKKILAAFPVRLLNTASACPPGLSRHHGYLIFGPEGWRRFDPDERLILAMSTSAKPLISTMTELSHRLELAHSNSKTGNKDYQDEINFINQQELKFITRSIDDDEVEELEALVQDLITTISSRGIKP